MDFFNVNIQQTDWQTSGEVLSMIRKQVFVGEQQIPESEEHDGLDEDASHWLATAPDNTPIGTARMQSDGKVGRIAVLPEYRNKGVASALLRRIIRFAQSRELESLSVDSQLQASGFFANFGFDEQGESFEKTGIAHVKMLLPLQRYSHPSPQPKLPEISRQDREHQTFDGADEFTQHAIRLLEKAELKVRIFTHKMDPKVYDNREICNLIQQVATSHPQADIRILFRDNQIIKAQSVGLTELAGRLGSNISVRQINRHLDKMHNDFMVVEEAGVLIKQDEQRYLGYSVNYSPMAARELAAEFDGMWDHSLPDPELTRLSL